MPRPTVSLLRRLAARLAPWRWTYHTECHVPGPRAQTGDCETYRIIRRHKKTRETHILELAIGERCEGRYGVWRHAPPSDEPLRAETHSSPPFMADRKA
jgi:hypothetical protein